MKEIKLEKITNIDGSVRFYVIGIVGNEIVVHRGFADFKSAEIFYEVVKENIQNGKSIKEVIKNEIID